MAMNQNYMMDDLTAKIKDMTLSKKTEGYWALGATKLVIGKPLPLINILTNVIKKQILLSSILTYVHHT